MDLAEFLTARFDEETAAANNTLADSNPWVVPALQYPDGRMVPLGDPVRVLREVEAKRAILDAYESEDGYNLPEGVNEGRDPDERMRDEAVKFALEYAVQHLAAVYSDHPDYDPAWMAWKA